MKNIIFGLLLTSVAAQANLRSEEVHCFLDRSASKVKSQKEKLPISEVKAFSIHFFEDKGSVVIQTDAYLVSYPGIPLASHVELNNIKLTEKSLMAEVRWLTPDRDTKYLTFVVELENNRGIVYDKTDMDGPKQDYVAVYKCSR
ncbi:MAG: hypothetical protein JST16_11410 [Bdellovibrionales bacterium]|nr:hypothetical protein [Bdellovibrionales bacterium]